MTNIPPPVELTPPLGILGQQLIVFAYGSLLRDEALEGYFHPAFWQRYPATVRGALYSLGSFPALCRDENLDLGDVPGEIIFSGKTAGDVERANYVDCLLMELGAGYTASLAEVTIEGHEGAHVEAVVFEFTAEQVQGLTRLPGDSWRRRNEIDHRPNWNRIREFRID